MTSSAPAGNLRVGLASAAFGFWLVSISPVIVASSGVHGVSMAFWRSWIGFGALAMIAGLRRQLSWHLLRRTAPAGVCFGLSIGLFFWASQVTSIANASLITVLQPIPLIVAAHYVFREALHRRDLAFAVAAIGGAVFLVLAADASGTGDIRGDLLAVVSILIGAGYFVFAKRCLETMDVFPFMAGMFMWAGLTLTPMVLARGESLLAESTGDWIRVLAVAIGPGLGHVMLNRAHANAPLNMVGLMQLLVPVNATLLAYFFLDQSLSTLQLVGMIVVMSALAGHAVTRSRLEPKVIA